MVFYMPNMQLTDKDWIYILINYLNGWTEIPFSIVGGYDIENLKFYDGFIGYLIKQTEHFLKENSNMLDKKFVDSWKYQGKIYRIIHEFEVEDENADDGYSCKLPDIEYHGMISHWTDDYTFQGLMYKLSSEEPYIILEADTQDHIAFDVNKFRKTYNCENPYIAKEREIIFPMYKECIKEYHMSVSKFINMKENKVNTYENI